ncbi:DHH family phosphoesterase [Halospeciosus flavus]|uniref:DHH family phosphoesterase n=1 Tax=Halospeciosus flavus TaxID=3032283 RepID=UPI00361730A9
MTGRRRRHGGVPDRRAGRVDGRVRGQPSRPSTAGDAPVGRRDTRRLHARQPRPGRDRGGSRPRAHRGLARLDAEPCYFGDISHQENRAFVNLLELDLRQLDAEEFDAEEFGGIALVDHSRPGVNDQLPPEVDVDVVIDHHPPKEEIEARFVDIREDMGATSTLMTEYLQRFNLELDRAVATALLYGIRVDTKDFSREITTTDFEAGADLLPTADIDVLERVESPSISADTLDIVARAIKNRHLDGTTLATCVGSISDRDALAQAADRLLAMEGVTVTFVYGFMEGTIYVSARSRGNEIDLGEVLREAFGEMGSAGGHADMAGAQIPLGVFEEIAEESESMVSILEDAIGERFFDAVRDAR